MKLKTIQYLVLFCIIFASDVFFAEGLLIERNARPLLAESTMEAMQPWETPLDGFFIRTHHDVMPSIVNDSWEVSFEGLVQKPHKMSLRSLKILPQVSFHAVLECSGNGRGFFLPQVSGIQWKRGAVGNAEWSGVELSHIFKNLKISSEAVYVTVEGFDEPVMKSEAKFVRTIPIKQLLDTHAILAFNMNRLPMPVVHGGPIRLVIPGIYGQNWIKWVTRMVFTKEPDERLYAKKAYRMPTKAVAPGEAWDPVKQGKPIDFIKVQTVITSPSPDSKVIPGKVSIKGKAFTGTGVISKVEISTDDGLTWTKATLYPPKDYAWQEFEKSIETQDGKTYQVLARATDTSGNVQPMSQEWNPKGYLYNAVDRIKIHADLGAKDILEGEILAKTHCQTCHSKGIAEGQRLVKSDWIKTVKKMADYGLKLEDVEVEKIAQFYSVNFPVNKPTDDSKTVETSFDASSLSSPGRELVGNSKNGGILFKKHCEVCHGVNAKGLVGPFLKGRAITKANYWSTVLNGKRKMPAFKDQITFKEATDIRVWLEL